MTREELDTILDGVSAGVSKSFTESLDHVCKTFRAEISQLRERAAVAEHRLAALEAERTSPKPAEE